MENLYSPALVSLLFFSLKALIVVVSVLVSVIVPIIFIKKISPPDDTKKSLKIENLKDQINKYIQQFKKKTLTKKEFKKYLKHLNAKKEKKDKPCLFILSFVGDIMASQVKNLREEISLILKIAQPKDEAVIILESRGGSVAHYGLAANQLQRFRSHNIPLTVCVDKVAGSGGYLMACVGNQILSSPFAFIGSIGVMFGLPNVYHFLKKYNINYEEFTAGKFKRTITPLGKVTEEKREQLRKQLDLIHTQFKNFVKQYRVVDLEQIATGEVWLAEEALKKGLVDKLQCSDDYILGKFKTHNVYKINLKSPKSLLEKVMGDKKNPSQKLLENLSGKDFFMV